MAKGVASSGMLHHVALVRTYVSEELSVSFIRVTRIGELGTMLVTAAVVPSSPILVTLMKEALSSFETSVLTRATRRNIPEDTILHGHRRENHKSYMTKGNLEGFFNLNICNDLLLFEKFLQSGKLMFRHVSLKQGNLIIFIWKMFFINCSHVEKDAAVTQSVWRSVTGWSTEGLEVESW
jgi:hypothetical protein